MQTCQPMITPPFPHKSVGHKSGVKMNYGESVRQEVNPKRLDAPKPDSALHLQQAAGMLKQPL